MLSRHPHHTGVGPPRAPAISLSALSPSAQVLTKAPVGPIAPSPARKGDIIMRANKKPALFERHFFGQAIEVPAQRMLMNLTSFVSGEGCRLVFHNSRSPCLLNGSSFKKIASHCWCQSIQIQRYHKTTLGITVQHRLYPETILIVKQREQHQLDFHNPFRQVEQSRRFHCNKGDPRSVVH